MYRAIGFIGTGNMGAALARTAAVRCQGAQILLNNRTMTKAEKLAEEIGGRAVEAAVIAETCDLIFLGVKPQLTPGLMKELEPVLQARTDRFVLITMAAGLSIDSIREMAGADYPVIRIMPNTPVSVGEGVIQYCCKGITEKEEEDFCSLMSSAGLVSRIPEYQSDMCSALSGCGPAFFAILAEALADGGVACGLPRDKAFAYTIQTMKGAAALLQETGMHPGVMKDGVCSPGGTTIQGIRTLEKMGLRSAVMEAVIAAYEKTVELGKD